MRRSAILIGAAALFATGARAQDAPPPNHPVGRPHGCDWLYSRQMQNDGLVGSVTVAFRVTERGGTSAIRLARTSGHDLLDQLGKSCVTRWKYIPATRDRVPVEVEWMARIDFGKPGGPPDQAPSSEGGALRYVEVVPVPSPSAAAQKP